MSNLSSFVPDLLRLVRLRYPDWSDFSDAKFVADEIVYKRDAAEFAREQLSHATLEVLLDAGDTEGFIARLKAVAGKTNLLFKGTPRTGDLALINQPDADLDAICRAMFDLLHGDGDAAERLGLFCEFVAARGLPQKWTFPTYYLFLVHPEGEIFVKPGVTEWLSGFTGGAIPYDSQPNGANYAAIRAGFHALRDALEGAIAPVRSQSFLPESQPGLGLHSSRPNMIDVQSVVYVAHSMERFVWRPEDIVVVKRGGREIPPTPLTELVALEKAAEQLKGAMSGLENHDDLVKVVGERDEVYARYGRLFAPENLPRLSAEEYRSFLLFENNRHWTGINRYGSRTVRDMDALRAALAILLDESRPLPERYDAATGGMVEGIGRAIATPILHVVYPDRYGVWNSKSHAGLEIIGALPRFERGLTDGRKYAAVNDVLQRLAATLDIDLWTLDTLWEVLSRRKSLAAPFDAIFADRAQAEWAFDLFADAVERLGGGPDDERFALTLRKGENRMRLNIGNSAVMDFADRGRAFNLTALKEPMENALSAPPWGAFSGESNKFGIFRIPIEQMQERREPLQAIYEQSMAEFGTVFSTWTNSNLLSSHVPQLFEALFDEEKRDQLLTHGLTQPIPQPRYWRITLPSDMPEDMSSDGKGSYNFWADNLRHRVAAIGFDNQSHDPQIARFASIRPGDRVVAFLRNKTIGGVGVVTSPLDEITAKERPAERDFFRGAMWRRIGVDWTPKRLSVDALPEKIRHKFGQRTVQELTAAEFGEVEKLMTTDSTIADEFKGFTPDAFAFMRELAENNNKAWMEANRERWRNSVLEPMRALFTDLGPHVKKLFDPYLLPDEMEIRPKKGYVLAQIHRNWTARTMGPYYPYYWGAFYRERLSKQDDAQLFINIFPDTLRTGFYMGHGAGDAFRRRLRENPTGFLSLVAEMELDNDFTFERTHPDGNREAISVKSADDLTQWTASNNFGFVRLLPPERVASLGSALVDDIYEGFRRVFPIYLWAVADEPTPLIERYMEVVYPSPVEIIDPPPAPYDFADFTRDTHLTNDRAAELEAMLRDKKQAIFYGPPGTGKTYVAKHLARLLTGLADPPPDRLTVVQFHPAYGYEEFIEGIRPRSEKGEDGRAAIDYPVRPGAFIRFCRAGAQLGDKPCVFIIDEINRGNIPRIFGELMYLLEYRDESIPLPYSGDHFRIPPNVYLIGTMNTADRSIALVDFALRRRFHFAHFAADPDLFNRWLAAHPPAVPWLGALYRRLTAEAIEDEAFRIGPSVFMRPGLDEAGLRQVWQWSIMPYLNEYYFDQRLRADLWAWDKELLRSIRGEHAG